MFVAGRQVKVHHAPVAIPTVWYGDHEISDRRALEAMDAFD